MTRPTDPTAAERRSEEVPEMVKPEMSDPADPADIGGAQAEANGVWRILRNSIVLAAAALALVAAGYAVMA